MFPPPSPWKRLATPDSNRTYLALLSFLPLKSLFRLPAFFRYTMQVRRQVESSSGAIGYSMGQDLLRLHFWTLSVWEDEAHLMDFVHALPHSHVMDALQHDMGSTAFVRWEIRGSELPPAWADALERQGKASNQDDSPRVIPIPPPLVYAGPLVLGLRLRKALPGVPLPRLLGQSLGGLLAAGGVLLSAWFFRTMRQAHTTINPTKPAATLVIDGPFQLTRNPGYLGMAGIYSGIALMTNALAAFLLLPVVLLVITRGVIEREEQYLERRFGEAYRAYKTRVRRWL